MEEILVAIKNHPEEFKTLAFWVLACCFFFQGFGRMLQK